MGLKALLGRRRYGPAEHPATDRMLVVGIGGGGCNVVNRLSQITDGDVKTVAINTDKRSLTKTYAQKRLLIGAKYAEEGTRGNIRLGKDCAMSSKKALTSALEGSEVTFLVCGLGGGTGTGATPTIARTAKEGGSFVISLVTLPFEFEKKRRKNSFKHLKHLRRESDIVVVIDNQRLSEVVPAMPTKNAFSAIDQLMVETILGLMSSVDETALASVGVSKLRRLAEHSTLATIMWGESLDPFTALGDSLNNPLLPISLEDVECALLNVYGGRTMDESNVNAIYQGLVEAIGENKDAYYSADFEQGRNSFRVMILCGINDEKD